MKLLVCVVLLCLAVKIHAAPRIVGGQDAPEGVYTHQVSLRYDGRHGCGGSIIDKRWILTAAHCVNSLGQRSLKIVAGTNLLQGGNEQVYEPEYISYHEDYAKLQNDIGLIRVSKDIEFNDKVQPIGLALEETYKVGDSTKLTGWGDLDLPGETPNKLQEIDLKLYDQDKCKKELSHLAEITIVHICTFTQRGQGACYGDSGGPLVSGGVQVGITSIVHPCATGRPDAFARVHTFLDWIAAQQAKFENVSISLNKIEN